MFSEKRLIGQRLSERQGQSFVVENRAGAGGSLGTETGVNCACWRSYLASGHRSKCRKRELHEKLSFNFIRDIALAHESEGTQ
jgi:hypothetical protein